MLKPKNTKNINLIVISIFAGLLVWVIDATVDYYLFYPNHSFWQILITEVTSFELYIRSIILFIFVLFGIIIQISSNKKTDYLNQLKISEIQLIDKNKELLKAKEKAEESDRLKSAFLANVSHEIRTPMNSILGFSELLKKDNLSGEEKEKYLDLIDSGGKRLITIISDIVDISKIDANQLSLTFEVCNLNKLIDDLSNQFSISRVYNNVSLKTSKALGDNESFIRTDETRLIQILSNLIENAQKFAKKGVIELGYTVNDKVLRFYVKDNGIGIGAKDLELVFERFGQVDSEYSRSGSGTGLGLSIAKGLVELLEGEIWIESKINQGATFYFTIPYNPVMQKVKKEDFKKDDVVESNNEVTILIAEDDDMNFMIFEKQLEEYNYNIIHAKNGSEAVELFSQNPSIDFVFMDIKMPVMNGLEATKEIRKINKHIPIIAQTAYVMTEDRMKAREVGCNDYLAKPITGKMLSEILNKYLKKA